MRGASHRRGETQKERLSREMDVSLRTAISLHSRKFDHSEETSFPLFLSFAIRKGVVNDDAEIFGSHRWVRSKFLSGGRNCWLDRQVFFFLFYFLLLEFRDLSAWIWSFVRVIGWKFGIDGSRDGEMFINLPVHGYTCMTSILFL